MRLSSGSGLTGLSGIRKRSVRNGIILLRPLLDFPKERLRETLRAYKQEWVEDPSNDNPRFFRGRLRQFIQEEGLTPSRLDQVIRKLQLDADFIQDVVNKAIHEMVQVHEGGYLSIKKESFDELHPAIAQRLLSFLMKWYSNADYAPRTTQMSGIMNKIQRGVPFTVGGIYWQMTPENIFLFREKRVVKEEISIASLEEKTLWDHRFWIDPQIKEYVPEDTILGSLGHLSFNLSGSSPRVRSTSRGPWKSLQYNGHLLGSRLRGNDARRVEEEVPPLSSSPLGKRKGCCYSSFMLQYFGM